MRLRWVGAAVVLAIALLVLARVADQYRYSAPTCTWVPDGPRTRAGIRCFALDRWTGTVVRIEENR